MRDTVDGLTRSNAAACFMVKVNGGIIRRARWLSSQFTRNDHPWTRHLRAKPTARSVQCSDLVASQIRASIGTS